MDPSLDPAQQFFAMFAQANTAIWPIQLVWYALALAAIVLAIGPTRSSNQRVAGFLAAYYLWIAIVFFAMYYRPLDESSPAFAVLFTLGGALFLLAGVVRHDLVFQPRWDLFGVTGGAFMGYGLAYPLLDALNGHLFPAAPVFGLAPCPSAIFTAGLLLWTRRPMPMYVLVVPLIWLMTQAPASALALGVVADLARVPVGVIATALLVWREYRARRKRLIAGAIMVLSILAVGNATVLMTLGAIYLCATCVAWYLHRQGRSPSSMHAHARAAAK